MTYLHAKFHAASSKVRITSKLKGDKKLVHCILRKWYFNLQKNITILYHFSEAIIKCEQWCSHVASYFVHTVIKDYKKLWYGVGVCSNIIMFALNFAKISKSVEKRNTNIMQSAQRYQRPCKTTPPTPNCFGTRTT